MTVARDFITHALPELDENSGSVMNDILIASKIMGLLFAGHDTTSSAITFVLKYLADFPNVYNEVLKGISSQQYYGHMSSFNLGLLCYNSFHLKDLHQLRLGGSTTTSI